MSTHDLKNDGSPWPRSSSSSKASRPPAGDADASFVKIRALLRRIDQLRADAGAPVRAPAGSLPPPQ
jgi:hypothetical protein